MKRILTCFLVIVSLSAAGCELLGLVDPPSGNDVPERIIIPDDIGVVDTLSSDAATVNEASLQGSILKLEVSYSGGCVDDHDFSLYWSGAFAETDPVTAGVFLTHDANGDACRSVLREELLFDVSPLVREYRQMEGGDRFIIDILEPTGEPGEFEQSDTESLLYRLPYE